MEDPVWGCSRPRRARPAHARPHRRQNVELEGTRLSLTLARASTHSSAAATRTSEPIRVSAPWRYRISRRRRDGWTSQRHLRSRTRWRAYRRGRGAVVVAVPSQRIRVRAHPPSGVGELASARVSCGFPTDGGSGIRDGLSVVNEVQSNRPRCLVEWSRTRGSARATVDAERGRSRYIRTRRRGRPVVGERPATRR